MKRSPLPSRKTPLKRVALKRTATPIKRTPIKRTTAQAARTPIRKAPARDATAAKAFRVAVMARSGGRCEACPILAGTRDDAAIAVARRCRGTSDHAHHKAPKGMGGHGDQSPENGVAMCDASHRFVHAYPAIGYACGLLARR